MRRVRLDEEKLEALRGWGERLRTTRGEESAAVGRAILMLVEEIDRLHIELWHARLEPRHAIPGEADTATDNEDETTTQGEKPELAASGLHARLQRVLRRAPVASEDVPLSELEEDGTGSVQAWIADLRGEK